MFPSAADDGLEPLRIRSADCVVNADDAAAALQEFFKILPVLPFNRPCFSREHHQHIRAIQLLARGKIHRSVDLRAALGKHHFPIAKPALVIVQPVPRRPMGLRAAAQKNPNRLLRPKAISRSRKETQRHQKMHMLHRQNFSQMDGPSKPIIRAFLPDSAHTGRFCLDYR